MYRGEEQDGVEREIEERQQRHRPPLLLLGVNGKGELPTAGESYGWGYTSSGEWFLWREGKMACKRRLEPGL
jgi:hypothetical protein